MKVIGIGDVGSAYPGAEEGPKGPSVRRLKRYVSWVQTVNLAVSDSNIGAGKSTHIGEVLDAL